MLLDIRHETLYRYATPATYSIQYLRLTPRTDGGQRVRHWRIDAPGRSWRQTDAFGNLVQTMSIIEPHSEVRVMVHGQVETADERGTLLPEDSAVPPIAFALPTSLTEPDAALRALAFECFGSGDSRSATPAQLEKLAEMVHERVPYAQGSTDVHATAATAWAQGAGVCQDMAHVFLAACRAASVPARYISGYVFDDHGRSTSHAWAEAWVADAQRGAGAWQGFDIANKRMSGPELVRLAVGRDYLDAGPVRGARLGGTDEEMTVSVSVNAVVVAPR